MFGRKTTRSAAVWRIAALVLLLFAAVDLVAIDTALVRTEATSDAGCGCPSDEDCFCCCRHIVVVPPIVFDPGFTVSLVEPPVSPSLQFIQPPAPFHPPRA